MSELSSVEYVNVPDKMPQFKFVEGHTPHWTYLVDYQNQPDVNVHALHKLHDVHVKLAVVAQDFDDERQEELDDAVNIINEVLADITDDYADRDSEKWFDLYMGNLNELPGVEKKNE